MKESAMRITPKLAGILRGFARRCPNCGRTPLFSGYLAVRSPCANCGSDNAAFPADDLPPYLTIMAVGHVVIPAFVWTDAVYVPSVWTEAAIWLPLTLGLTLALLPSMKGMTIGISWATGITRDLRRTPRS
jgi:uncharacterized protein (DUF983 family)